MTALSVQTTSQLPNTPRPIVMIGAGGIVNDAHLPAYKKAGLPVAGIFDLDGEKALHHKYACIEGVSIIGQKRDAHRGGFYSPKGLEQ